LAYDAWGKRRNTDGTDEPLAQSIPSLLDQNAITNRGFTGHEHLEELALVHMNGRIYDPLLGRFLSADPNVQDPVNLQSFNRYSYVLNNPLAYTDPSGYFSIGKIFKSIKHFFQSQPILALAVGIGVATLATGPFGLGIGVGFFGGLTSIQGAVIAGGVTGLLTGGLKGALIGGAMGALTFGIGQAPIDAYYQAALIRTHWPSLWCRSR
ncbi:MAG: RHS repeat-associated core domain-containing protein, partial [Caldilineaceae bacterium]|nr:RHS repeat-associated core domain-containing protein [Caldilineaceae bacterium]